ncbi:hypothetical protein V5F89_08180 [Pelagerythrobacter marensis]|uniref:Uncharacterized protein n=1 Tax=Pelagerythrobacter marensis TaxID=543877 RepID=A0ABZ2D3B4_9SPHN
MTLANPGREVYLAINPDIVATLEGLAPRGAGHEALAETPVSRMSRNLETRWPIWRA